MENENLLKSFDLSYYDIMIIYKALAVYCSILHNFTYVDSWSNAMLDDLIKKFEKAVLDND